MPILNISKLFWQQILRELIEIEVVATLGYKADYFKGYYFTWAPDRVEIQGNQYFLTAKEVVKGEAFISHDIFTEKYK